MAVNANRVRYERRLAVVEQLLHSRDLQPSSISTMAYSEEYQYTYNNFLYKVELASPASPSSFPGTQPGTTEAPSGGISALVIKLSNLTARMNHVNRVENDVAAQFLVRQSMAQAGLAPLVPAIYAWAPATVNGTGAADETCFGWTMSELMSGVDLDPEFLTLELKDKEHVLEQIAAILAAIQKTRLPETVTSFGGLTFDLNGQIVSGEEPIFVGAPVSSYTEQRVAKLRRRLPDAAKNPVILGWKRNRVDARIERFLTSGGPEKVLAGVDPHLKGLIHGDFTTNNMLFDKSTKRVTAIVDFDWSYVSNPFEEFMSLLSNIGCNITQVDNDINMAMLSGDFTLDKEATKKWEVVKAWNSTMKKSGVVSPSDMKGVDGIRDMVRLQKLLHPPTLSSESKLEQMDDEEKAELLAKAEADLVQWLEKYGF